MAKNDNTAAAEKKERKERRPARTIEERIAELQRVADERASKDRAKATAQLTKLNDAIVKLESKLGDLYVARDAAMAVLGGDTAEETAAAEDEIGTDTVGA